MLNFREWLAQNSLNEKKKMPMSKRAISTYVKEYDMYDEFAECTNDANFWLHGKGYDGEIEINDGKYTQNGKKLTKAGLIDYAFKLMQEIKSTKGYSDKKTLELFNLYDDMWNDIVD